MLSVNQSLSLFIPHVFTNITDERIFDIFYDLALGIVKRVDRVLKRDPNDNEYHSVYIHFEQWFANHIVVNFQERVVNPAKEARLVYDDPWYWIVLENKGVKRVPGDRKPTLKLTEDTPEKHSETEFPEEFPEESFELVDSQYVEFCEAELSEARDKVARLENELWTMHQTLIAERQANEFLNKEIIYERDAAYKVTSANEALQEEIVAVREASYKLTKRVEELQENLEILRETLIIERRNSFNLTNEVATLEEELARTFKPFTEDKDSVFTSTTSSSVLRGEGVASASTAW